MGQSLGTNLDDALVAECPGNQPFNGFRGQALVTKLAEHRIPNFH